jgi:hypothetical protein
VADLRAMLRRLERLAREVGTPVRYDAVLPKRGRYVVRGGLCTVNGRTLIVCDRALPIVEKIAVVAQVLAARGIEVMELPPILRARLRAPKAKPKKARVRGKGIVEKAG